jgi:hypothetical protein
MSAVDDVITRITEAEDNRKALAIAMSLSRRLVEAVADQLHIETAGHEPQWLRGEIVKEARS